MTISNFVVSHCIKQQQVPVLQCSCNPRRTRPFSQRNTSLKTEEHAPLARGKRPFSQKNTPL
ncbi:hypothetical protein EYF80_015795 [Liparis tanakae]|uniref:Uncharacterized protein n=1 Tax=Liparis tanakae TaxID=230148 RepID=A0A4Z2I9C9_9TELE|nr:hypothetical protein EYF80_015795 [Liparis tanakae]